MKLSFLQINIYLMKARLSMTAVQLAQPVHRAPDTSQRMGVSFFSLLWASLDEYNVEFSNMGEESMKLLPQQMFSSPNQKWF